MFGEPPTLYHYCRPEVFVSIVANRSVWLSSLSQSNDSQEGKLVSGLIDYVVDVLRLTPIGAESIRKLVRNAEEAFRVLGLCLSTDGDVLSQWRAYAADGAGVAIGFNLDFLRGRLKQEDIARASSANASASLERVVYQLEEQQDLLLERLSPLKDLSDDEWLLGTSKDRPVHAPLPQPFLLRATVLDSLAEVVFLMKGKAFSEEKEWRMFMPYVSWAPKSNFMHRASMNQIIPYMNVVFPQDDNGLQIIDRVVLGPKHKTPEDVVENFLHQNGFWDVIVERSKASYQ